MGHIRAIDRLFPFVPKHDGATRTPIGAYHTGGLHGVKEYGIGWHGTHPRVCPISLTTIYFIYIFLFICHVLYYFCCHFLKLTLKTKLDSSFQAAITSHSASNERTFPSCPPADHLVAKPGTALEMCQMNLFTLYEPYQERMNEVAREYFPEASQRNREAVNSLKAEGDGRQQQVGKTWISDWCIFSIAVNRTTAIHRDQHGAREGIDGLSPLGSYRGARMDIPGLGISLDYCGGSMLILMGSLLHHGTSDFSGGERMLIIHSYLTFSITLGLDRLFPTIVGNRHQLLLTS